MAERIAILGGEPYGEWIKRNGPAQRMYKAYAAKWPGNNAACFVAGDDFYVRFNNGNMRYVDCVGDFDDEAEWRMRQELRTPRYTTRLEDIPIAVAG